MRMKMPTNFPNESIRGAGSRQKEVTGRTVLIWFVAFFALATLFVAGCERIVGAREDAER